MVSKTESREVTRELTSTTSFCVPYLCSVDMKGPETRHRFRGVNCTLMIGVLFVGNVASRSDLKNRLTESNRSPSDTIDEVLTSHYYLQYDPCQCLSHSSWSLLRHFHGAESQVPRSFSRPNNEPSNLHHQIQGARTRC